MVRFKISLGYTRIQGLPELASMLLSKENLKAEDFLTQHVLDSGFKPEHGVGVKKTWGKNFKITFKILEWGNDL